MFSVHVSLRRPGVRAAVVAVSLIASLFSAVAVQASQSTAVERAPTLPPPLESAPLEPDVPSIPEGDFTQAPPRNSAAESPGLPPGPKSLPLKIVGRTATSTTYANPNGSNKIAIHRRQVNWRDEHGVWREIDPNLKPRTGGRFENFSAPARISVAGAIGDNDLVRIERGNWSVAFTPVGMAAGRRVSVKDGRAHVFWPQ